MCILSGIHLITSSGSRVSYVNYNLNTLKVEQDCLFPADTQALLGRSDYGITLHNCGEVGSPFHLHIVYMQELTA